MPIGYIPDSATPTINLENITKVKETSSNTTKALDVAPKKQQSITIRDGLNLSANPVTEKSSVPTIKPN